MIRNLFFSNYLRRAAGFRLFVFAAAFAVAAGLGAVDLDHAGDFLAWTMIVTVPGADLRRGIWEQGRVRGESPVRITTEAILARWVPALAVLVILIGVGASARESLGAAAQLLAISSVGVFVGHLAPSAWIQVPAIWGLVIAIPMMSGGRFLSHDLAGDSAFSGRLAAHVLLAFAFAMADSNVLSRGVNPLEARP